MRLGVGALGVLGRVVAVAEARADHRKIFLDLARPLSL
jgi:hypothetical protein